MPIIKNNLYALLCQIKDCFCVVTRTNTIPAFNQSLDGNLTYPKTNPLIMTTGLRSLNTMYRIRINSQFLPGKWPKASAISY